VQLFVLANEKRIATAQLNLSRAQANAASVLSEAASNHEAVLGVADQQVKIFGGTIEGATNALRGALGLGPVHTYENRQGDVVTSGGGGGGGKKRHGASGLLFDTSGSTDLTVGEAGREKVAVLKNPQKMALSGALGPGVMGGAPIVIGPIYITGNTISNEMDLDQIADRLTDKIEDRLSTKAKLLSVR
jgi:hypothetical protein